MTDRPGRFFTWSELRADAAPETHREALRALCAAVLDPLREAVGPVTVTSGWRSAARNAAVGGATGSQHERGEAADVVVSGMTPRDVARRVIDLGLPFDQLIWYPDEPRGGWVHVSHGPRHRRQVLRATPGPTRRYLPERP